MIIYILDLFGVAVFAVSGALAAGIKRMDVFGVVVVAIVTAIGGGTHRDVVLGVDPVLWTANPLYVIIATGAALATFILPEVVRRAAPVLLVFDALGLAVFTVIGCQTAVTVGIPYVSVVVMGVITGVAGGVIRDMLCGEIPLVLRKEIYATASIAGGTTFVLLFDAGVRGGAAALIAASVTLIIRLIAIRYRLSLPTLEVGSESDRTDTQ